MYGWLFTKVNANSLKINTIDAKVPRTSWLASKTQYDSDKQGVERKIKDVYKILIPNTIGLVTTTAFNSKVTDIENKISDITNLVTKAWIRKLQRLKVKYLVLVILLKSRILRIK